MVGVNKMKKVYNNEEWKRLSEEYDKVKYQCKNCGHKVVIPYFREKQLCSWCKNYVFKNEIDEFKYRLNEKRKEVKK
jgi:hypothetical protein